eukprot:3689391-Prymnesium_polylepis.1
MALSRSRWVAVKKLRCTASTSVATAGPTTYRNQRHHCKIGGTTAVLLLLGQSAYHSLVIPCRMVLPLARLPCASVIHAALNAAPRCACFEQGRVRLPQKPQQSASRGVRDINPCFRVDVQ